MSTPDSVTVTRTAAPAAGQGAPAQTTLTLPKKLGPVTLIRELGAGGMGTVWLGRDELLNREVAVKLLVNVPASADDPRFSTFLEGARHAAALRHANLNAVLHADVAQGVPYIVMDLVEGPTLAQLVQAAGTLSPAVVRVVLDAACAGVAELHDHDIIHRDIKPSNILIEPDGTVVLTDFGLACTRPVSALGASVEGVAGTPAYMAPEMFERSISARGDVYALGIMLFELLAGELPFRGTLDEVRAAHRDRPLPPDKLGTIPPALAGVIEQACHKSPMFRYKTARNMQRALDAAFASLDQLQVARARGEGELARLATRWTRGDSVAGATAAASTPNVTYYDQLATFVERRKKGEFGDTPSGGVVPSPEDTPRLIDTAPQGTRCARCSRDLSGLAVTGRCPECLLLVRLTLNPGGQPIPPMPAARDPVPPPPPPSPAQQQATAPSARAGLWGKVRSFLRGG